MKKLLRKCLNFRLTGWSMAIALFSLFSANTASAADLYLVGEINGWEINSSSYKLSSTSTNVYEGTINIPQGKFMFRFYTALGDWDNNSYGSQSADNPLEINLLSTGSYSNTYSGWNGKYKGSWQVSNWPGGDVTMKVDLTAKTVLFTTNVGIDYSKVNLYVIGGNVNGSNWALGTNPMTYNASDGTFVWTGETLGSAFKINDGSWSGAYNIGGTKVSGDNAAAITEGVAYNVINNSNAGNIVFSNTSEVFKNPKLVLDLAKMTLTLTGNVQELEPIFDQQIYVVGDINSWDFNQSSYTLPKTAEKVYEGDIEISSGSSINFRFLTSLGSSSDYNYGANKDDNVNTDITVTAEKPFTGDMVYGQGNWVLSSWAGGSLHMKVDFNEPMNVTFSIPENAPEPEPATLYVRGNSVNGENTFNSVSDAAKMTYDDGVYTWSGESLGTGFKIADANWTAETNYGGDGQDITITMNGNPVTVVANSGSKNIVFQDGSIYVVNPVITFDPETMTVALEGESTAKVAVTSMVIRGTLDGVWADGGGVELFTLSPDADNNNLWTGTMTGLTPDSEFQIVVNGNFWYGWSATALYSNAPVNVNLNSSNGDNLSFTNILETSTVNVSVNWETGEVSFSSENQPVLQPDMLWAIGPFNGWQTGETEYVLEQTGDNTGVYTGTFDWDETCEYDDNEVNFADFKLAFGDAWSMVLGNPTKEVKVIYSPNTTYETSFLVGSGENWTISNWAGGEITITVDLNKQTVTIECPDQPAFQYPASVTLMGSFDSWTQGYEMEDLGNGSYSVSATLPKENIEFKILADDVWYGALAGQSNVVLKLNTPVEYEMTDGEASNWTLVNFAGGDVVFTANITEDGTTLTINQTTATAINGLFNSLNNGEEVIFNLQGVRVNKNNLRPGIYIVNGKKVVIR